MPIVVPLTPEDYRRLPWKNGLGELIVIDREGGDSWQNMGVAWHFGRTAIIQDGPFSDYFGYERLQVVTKGAGLVLEAPDHEIDLRRSMRPQRFDGGTPIRTRLEQGPVEVVNLIADRERFDIDLCVCGVGEGVTLKSGVHVVYAAVGPSRLNIDARAEALDGDHALRVSVDAPTSITIQFGRVLIGSIYPKA